MREQLNRQARELKLRCAKHTRHLWGTGSLSLEQLPDPNVRLLLQRLITSAPLIRRLKLGDMSDTRATEYRLEFQQLKGDTLTYQIITLYGSQELEMVAFPGLSYNLLEKIGRQISI